MYKWLHHHSEFKIIHQIRRFLLIKMVNICYNIKIRGERDDIRNILEAK